MKLADIVRGDWLNGLDAIPAIPQSVGKPEIATIAVAVRPAGKIHSHIDPFFERRDRLQQAGLDKEDAGLMAFKLERRDREGDERHVCIECRHLVGSANGWWCSQWQQCQPYAPEIPSDMVTLVLHRCDSFYPGLGQK